MNKLFLMALVITGFVYSACDDDDNAMTDDTTLPAADRNFMINTSEANQAEIELGQLAATQASDEDVKVYGQLMVDEHRTAQDELDSLAEVKDVDITVSLNAKHQALKERLMALTGFQFDTAYIKSQAMDHRTVKTMFETQIQAGNDKDVKSYAGKYLPHIDMHLVKADSISNALNQ